MKNIFPGAFFEKNKVRYTASLVPCGLAGAVLEKVTRSYGQEPYAQQVIQGSHMVSGTRCPAWSDLLKQWSESRAAADVL